MKRFIAILLAMVMVLGLGTMAMAAAPNEKVQINNMMVDASLYEAKTQEAIELQTASTETAIATTANNPGDNAAYAPINEITVDWPNSEVKVPGIMQGRVIYEIKLPGASTADLSGRTLTFKITDRAAMNTDDTVTMTLGTVSCTAKKNSSASMTVDLSTTTQNLNVNWTENGTARSAVCMINVTTPTGTSVELADTNGLTIAGVTAAYDVTTVGGVTRYSYAAELPNGTNETALDAATVVATPKSSTATLTLKNADGSSAATGSKNNGAYTFTNVNFNSGAKTLTVADGDLTRDYQVSADINGRHITVYVAFRGYLADQWFKGEKLYYDYGANGYGDGSSITDEEESERITSAITAMLALKGTNTPSRIVGTNKRAVFEKASYIPVTLTVTDHSNESDRLPGMTVYDALIQAIADYNAGITVTVDGESVQLNPGQTHNIAQHGAENNYVDYMTFDGNDLGEFDCGSASGWMFTARTDIDDVTSTLPNAGLRYWSISDGMFIDWYYTAAYGMDFGYSMFDI